MASIQTKSFTDNTGQALLIRTPRVEDASAILAYVGGVAAETDSYVIEPDELPDDEDERKWIREHLAQTPSSATSRALMAVRSSWPLGLPLIGGMALVERRLTQRREGAKESRSEILATLREPLRQRGRCRS